jgi:hypothetical protein
MWQLMLDASAGAAVVLNEVHRSDRLSCKHESLPGLEPGATNDLDAHELVSQVTNAIDRFGCQQDLAPELPDHGLDRSF